MQNREQSDLLHEFERTLPALLPTWQLFRRSGIAPPIDFPDHLARLLTPETLSILCPHPNPDDLAGAWIAFLSKPSQGNELARIPLLYFFVAIFDASNPNARMITKALGRRHTPSGHSLNRSGSQIEAKRRLSANLFLFGRGGRKTPINQVVLEEALLVLNDLLREWKGPRARAIRQYIGMRGVCHLLLAKASKDARAHYESAQRDLEDTSRLGDTSLEHDQYLGECYIHLYEITQQPSLLDQAETLVRRQKHRYRDAPLLHLIEGQVASHRGFCLASNGSLQEASDAFLTAIHLFTDAINCPPDPKLDIAYVRELRATCSTKLYSTQRLLGQIPDAQWIDLAIADLTAQPKQRTGTGPLGFVLPSALLERAQMRVRNKNYSGAMLDLRHAASIALPDSKSESLLEQIRSVTLGCRLWKAIEDQDVSEVEIIIGEATALGASAQIPVVALVHGARFLSRELHSDSAVTWLIRVADSLCASLQASVPDDSSRRFLASHAATLILAAAKRKKTRSLFTRAYDLYQQAMQAGTEPVPLHLLINAGETALRLAKSYLKSDQSVRAYGFLRDATELLLRAMTLARERGPDEVQTFKQVICHSKLGEALLRLHAMSQAPRDLQNAIHHLLVACRMGNRTPYIIGLLGDAYIRSSKRDNNVRDMRRAVRLKAIARRRGHSSRENWSAVARAHEWLWRKSGDTADLARSLELICQAAIVDSTWPWPWFQSAELLASCPSLPLVPAIVLPESVATHPIAKAFKNRDQKGMYSHGCALVLRNAEFTKKKLGGRQFVYILDDQHRLIGTSYVFKETEREDADRDKRIISEFCDFLRRNRAPHDFLLPEPLGLHPLSGSKVSYMMRRAAGKQLGMAVFEDERSKAETVALFRRALTFLALYHGWAMNRFGHIGEADLGRIITRLVGENIGIPNTVRKAIEESLQTLMCKNGIATVLKKDAHPENWLVTPDDSIVMLDFEARRELPLLFEVVQLLDDYPLLETTLGGWQHRITLAMEYLETISMYCNMRRPDDRIVSNLYGIFAILRVVSGLARTSNSTARRRVRSSASARALFSRRTHYRGLLDFIAQHHEIERVRDFAMKCLDAGPSLPPS